MGKRIKYTGRYAGQRLPRRITAMLAAVIIMGIGVSLYVLGGMGADPFSTLIFFIDRSMLGLGTLGNMFLIGITADICNSLLADIAPPTEELGIPLRVALTLLGVVCQILGCSFYVTANLGMAPYDCVSFIVPNRTKIPFRWWRIISDFTCVAIGFLCGATVGLGTLIMAFGTGPLLPLCNKYIAAPALKIADIPKG